MESIFSITFVKCTGEGAELLSQQQSPEMTIILAIVMKKMMVTINKMRSANGGGVAFMLEEVRARE